MGVTCLSYNPKKAIIATGSDDTTWKLWAVPNGDLIMSGEGHLDWIGGLAFSPEVIFWLLALAMELSRSGTLLMQVAPTPSLNTDSQFGR